MNFSLSHYLSLSGTLSKKVFLKRFVIVCVITVFVAGYFWVLALSYPHLSSLPVIVLLIAVSGHTIAAIQVLKRMRLTGSSKKSRVILFVPFFGVMYALPSALKEDKQRVSPESRQPEHSHSEVSENA